VNPSHKKHPDPLLYVAGALLALPFAYLIYLIVSVVLLGESSACPQNLC
jgi:hypothetical protein